MIDYDNFGTTIKKAYQILSGQNPAPLPEEFFVEQDPESQKLPTGLCIDRKNNLIFEAVSVNGKVYLVGTGLLFARSEAGAAMDRRLGLVSSAEAAYKEHVVLRAAGKESLPRLSILPVETNIRMRRLEAAKAPN